MDALEFDLETITVKAPGATFDILTAQSLTLPKVGLIRSWGSTMQALDGSEDEAELETMVDLLAKTLIVDINAAKLHAFQQLGVGQLMRIIQAVFQSMTQSEQEQPEQ